jgi:hypothetical protein
MKNWLLTLATTALLSLSVTTSAAAKSDSGSRANDSIRLGYGSGFANWRPIARDELIVWATRSKPYLVKIWRPASGLRFAQSIGFTSFAGRVTHLDSIYVDGQRLPIKSIVALDREVAEQLGWRTEK